MKAGTYTMVLYKDEFKVAQQSVLVSSGQRVTSNIASTEGNRNTVWRIGEFDGRPVGFRNAANQLRMHPSDSRMSYWGPLTYTVGSSFGKQFYSRINTPGDWHYVDGFPMAQIVAVNNPTTIQFSISNPSGSYTLRIGTTLANSGARPQAKVNNWTRYALFITNTCHI
jgi:rhamnogalacturonan endolyase